MMVRNQGEFDMETTIRLLSEETINAIAAGEVIENPASVVKELIENAIDAGASSIHVELLSGGLQLIRVSDNGRGMSRADAFLSIERHATSKLRDADDLFKILTMGFRGEALASIAAISKMTLSTSLCDGEGTILEIEGGKIKECNTCARKKGTTIEIRSLFFNVPARKKFQKSPALCTAEITRLVTTLSLAHPEVSFEVKQQDRQLLSLAKADGANPLELFASRGLEALGNEYFASILTVEKDLIQGFIGSPMQTRHNRSGQFLYINRRPVNCPLVSYAVRDAFGTRISEDRFPVFFLHLQIPPDLIDVNVHPQKKEIRLSNEREIKDRVQAAIENVLRANEAAGVDTTFALPEMTFTQEPSFDFPMTFKEERSAPLTIQPGLALHQEKPKILGLFSHFLLIEAGSLIDRVEMIRQQQDEAGIVMVDLYAAHSRILFDAFLEKQDYQIENQGLIFPLTLEFIPTEAQLIEEHLELLEKVGFALHPIGRNAFLLNAIPPFIEADDAKEVLMQILEEIVALQIVKGEDERKKREYARATSRLVKNRKVGYSLLEAERLFEELLRSKGPSFCPLGHPTMVHLKRYELEQFFDK